MFIITYFIHVLIIKLIIVESLLAKVQKPVWMICLSYILSIRFLATGDSYSTIANSFRVGASTVVEIVRTTCSVLWSVVQPVVMQQPDKQKWIEIDYEFEKNGSFLIVVVVVVLLLVDFSSPTKVVIQLLFSPLWMRFTVL
jgi:hypothetical protein